MNGEQKCARCGRATRFDTWCPSCHLQIIAAGPPRADCDDAAPYPIGPYKKMNTPLVEPRSFAGTKLMEGVTNPRFRRVSTKCHLCGIPTIHTTLCQACDRPLSS